MFTKAHLCALLLQVAPLLTIASPGAASFASTLERRDPPTCVITPVTPPGPPPRGFYCNKQGSIKRPAIIQTSNQANVNACRDLCLNSEAGCRSFSYGPNRKCVTYSKNIVDQGFTAGNTGQAFSNRKCFKKTCTCPTGQTNCSNNCVDLQTDESNCGTCGTVVPSGDTCCAGQGVDLQTDEQNCGTCGNAVEEGQTCCGGQSTDTTTDNNNCGACGTVVSEGNTCCSGQGVDLTSDPNNCGSCGNVVGEGQTCCNGSPVTLSSDSGNCSACGNTCGAGASCTNGACACPFGQGLCSGPNGPCSDTYSDPNNCGACGNVCDGGVCYHGVCPNCSGDFCSQSAGTPCGTAGNCNCVGIEGSSQYGVCTDVNDGTSCEAFTPRCSTNADCPSDKFCFNYQVSCNCARKACAPKSNRCSNTASPSRLFRQQPKIAAAADGLTAKGGQ